MIGLWVAFDLKGGRYSHVDFWLSTNGRGCGDILGRQVLGSWLKCDWNTQVPRKGQELSHGWIRVVVPVVTVESQLLL